jgi:hypothetical protein
MTDSNTSRGKALKRLSPKRLLIIRDAQSSRHSQKYVLVEGGLAYASNPIVNASRR